jgi:ketosteroid isomerase-like protein
MSASDLAQIIEHSHRALDAFMKGDAAPAKSLFSRRDDVTLANPFGPPVRGWPQIEPTLDRAAAHYREGEVSGFERISEFATGELAYVVEVERLRAKVGGADEITPLALRVTTIFRREDGAWKIVHRHADPITTPRPADSVVPH